jgi:Cys-tRNA(Pro)/Cys-tRNA(Cys) deacylase
VIVTAAMSELDRIGIPFDVRVYQPGVSSAVLPPELAPEKRASVVKTLILRTPTAPICAVLSYLDHLNLRVTAKIAHVPDTSLMAPGEVSQLTGYELGGISPLGMSCRLQTYFDVRVLEFSTIYINGGRKGIQLALNPVELVRILEGVVADIARHES